MSHGAKYFPPLRKQYEVEPPQRSRGANQHTQLFLNARKAGELPPLEGLEEYGLGMKSGLYSRAYS